MKTSTHLEIHHLQNMQANMKGENPLGCLQTEKGDMAFLNLGAPFNFAAVVEFKPNFPARGNHFHNEKQENFYIISGSLQATFWDPDNTADEKEITLKKGDLVIIKPGLAHKYEALEETLALELSPQPYKDGDTIYVGA